MLQVVRLPPSILAQYNSGGLDLPVVVYGGVQGTNVLACGGLAWIEGRCFAFLDVLGDMTPHTLTLFRQARRVLLVARQLGESEVFVYRDEHPRSARLLAMLGFECEEFDEPIGKEIWKCQVLKP